MSFCFFSTGSERARFISFGGQSLDSLSSDYANLARLRFTTDPDAPRDCARDRELVLFENTTVCKTRNLTKTKPSKTPYPKQNVSNSQCYMPGHRCPLNVPNVANTYWAEWCTTTSQGLGQRREGTSRHGLRWAHVARPPPNPSLPQPLRCGVVSAFSAHMFVCMHRSLVPVRGVGSFCAPRGPGSSARVCRAGARAAAHVHDDDGTW